ncbi:MAG: DEAD/DEAH box helicase, partial [Anaerolineae bacterium]|nr:DEAD/DEAH box helicase [Anaerolineae bacterium]
MNIFDLRQHITTEYQNYARGFINIADSRIQKQVEEALHQEAFLPEPLIQLNPNFESGGTITDLVAQGLLHPECESFFRRDKDKGVGEALRLHYHQREAIALANAGHSYILTTGTGSGKSLAYIIPIVNHILTHPDERGIKAIIVYPMNALANSQYNELEKYLGKDNQQAWFDSYTGQDDEAKRQRIIENPPHILLTNFMMLELLMTRERDQKLLNQAKHLRFLVLDELHTYRGRQGADVSLLVRRVRNRLNSSDGLQCIGTSATLASEGAIAEQTQTISEFATKI